MYAGNASPTTRMPRAIPVAVARSSRTILASDMPRMLRHVAGDEAFKKMLKAYLTENAGKSAGTESFRKVAEAKVGHWCQGAAWNAATNTLLVQCMVEQEIMVFRFDGEKLKDTGQRIALKGGAAAIRTAERPR